MLTNTLILTPILPIFLVIGFRTTVGQVPPDIEFVSGVQRINLADDEVPVFYSSYLVLLINERFPDFPFEAFNFTNACTKTESSYCNYATTETTITKYWFDKEVNNTFLPELGYIKEYELALRSSTKEPSSTSQTDCDEILFSTKDVDTLKNNITEYTESLRRCYLSEDKYSVLEPSHQVPDKSDYTEMAEKFRAFFGLFWSGNQLYAMRTLGHAQAFPYLLMHYQLESQRWKDALSRCLTNQIPPEILSPAELEKHLKSIESRIGKSGYRLSIPVDHLAPYYRLPLADCAFTSNGSLVTRVQVPILELGFQYETFTLTSIPFMRTENGRREICSVTDFGGRTFIVNQDSLLEFKCRSKELCAVPKSHIYRAQVSDPCLSSILANGTEDPCPLNCVAAPKDLPIFHPMSADTILMIGGDPGTKLFMQCTAARATTVHDLLTPIETGSLKIRLPCNCQLVLRGKEIFRASDPCNSEAREAISTVIRPYSWKKERTENGTTRMVDPLEESAIPVGSPLDPIVILAGVMAAGMVGVIITLGWIVYQIFTIRRQVGQGPNKQFGPETLVRLTRGESADNNAYADQILFGNH